MRLFQNADVESDIESAADWYDQQRPGVGTTFLDAVAAGLAAIEQSPRAFGYARPPVPGREVRRYNLRRFPYADFYEVRGDDVFVLTVIHASRRPGRWHARLPPADP